MVPSISTLGIFEELTPTQIFAFILKYKSKLFIFILCVWYFACMYFCVCNCLCVPVNVRKEH